MLKNTEINEQGRSMVEMLGVLAVIGILSVAGIAGYTTAMNKHRANELLNEASKRATIVAMQVAQGRTGNLSVAEFGDNNWSVTTNGLTNQFGIVSPSVTADVCKQVVNTVGTGTIIKKVLSGSTDATGDASKCGDAVVTLVYNDDMSVDGGNIVCNAGIVKVYDCESKTTTDCCPDTQICEQPTNCGCTSNDDCPGEQICDSNHVCTCYNEYGDNFVLGKDGITCCSYGKKVSDGSVNIPICGCPYDISNGDTPIPQNGVCCSRGMTYDAGYEVYRVLDIQKCGCPLDYEVGGGKEIEGVLKNGVCCSQGTTLVDSYSGLGRPYGKLDIEHCGCPIGWYDGPFYYQGELKNSVCCYGGKMYDVANEGYSISDSRCE